MDPTETARRVLDLDKQAREARPRMVSHDDTEEPFSDMDAAESALREASIEAAPTLARALLESQAQVDAMRKAIESASSALAFHSRDHGTDHRDAWVYGIICGWEDDGGDAVAELAARHKWTAETVARLRRFRAVLSAAPATPPADTKERR